MKGKGYTMYTHYGQRSPMPDLSLQQSIVTCNDIPPMEPPTAEEVLNEYLSVYKDVSPLVLSATISEPDPGCEYWSSAPKERSLGAWNHTLRNPVLVISHTDDEGAPIASGLHMKEILGSSASMLLYDTPLHTSISLPSSCISNYTYAYFKDGTLPSDDARCRVVDNPFGPLDACDQSCHLAYWFWKAQDKF